MDTCVRGLSSIREKGVAVTQLEDQSTSSTKPESNSVATAIAVPAVADGTLAVTSATATVASFLATATATDADANADDAAKFCGSDTLELGANANSNSGPAVFGSGPGLVSCAFLHRGDAEQANLVSVANNLPTLSGIHPAAILQRANAPVAATPLVAIATQREPTGH